MGAEYRPHPARLDGTSRWIATPTIEGSLGPHPPRADGEPEHSAISAKTICFTIRARRMGSETNDFTLSLAFHRQFHPDELDGAEIPAAKFSTHFFDARPDRRCPTRSGLKSESVRFTVLSR